MRTSRFVVAVVMVIVALGLRAGPAAATTVAAQTFAPRAGTLGAIPDGTATTCGHYGASRDVPFDVTGFAKPVDDVSVTFAFNPSHTWAGDVLVELVAPDATSQKIFEKTGVSDAASDTACGDSADLTGPYTFSDAATASWWSAAGLASQTGTTNSTTPVPSGTYRAAAPGSTTGGGGNVSVSAAFTHLTSANGTWDLRFFDGYQGDTGSVSSASLSLRPAAPDLTLPPASPTFSCAVKRGKKVCKIRGIVISNTGDADDTVRTVIRLYKSQAALDAGHVWTSSRLPRIVKGQTIEKSIVVPTRHRPAGFIAVVDAKDGVDELDETNNQQTYVL